MTVSLERTPPGATISNVNGERVDVTSAKWVTFLTLLTKNSATTFEKLYQNAEFREGRNGPKTTRTVAVEVDNFRRKVRKFGLLIEKTRTAGGVTYSFNINALPNVDQASFEQHLGLVVDPRQDLHDLITAPLADHMKWLFETMRAKVAFARGEVTASLQHHQTALRLADDKLLVSATYAEIARITYRADRDLAIDMRDAAMAFAQSSQIDGLIQEIYEPRIRTAYAFQDDRSVELLAAETASIVSRYVSNGIDVAGLARALNTHGGAIRKLDGDEAAIPYVRLASVLSITINDVDLVQASLFNLLACLEFSNSVPPELKIEGSEVNYWFCEAFNVGKDSAQCSLLASQFYLEKGDLALATQAIERSAQLMAGERNSWDMAYFFYCRARLGIATATRADLSRQVAMARARLDRADRLYRKLGNLFGLRKVERFRKLLNAETGPTRP